MGKTYYKILRKYVKDGEHHIEFEFSDEEDGFFLPTTVVGDSEEEVNSNLQDFLGTNSQLIK